MTKRILSIVLCAFSIFSFSACKKKTDTNAELPYYNYDLSSYVTLKEYKALRVEKFSTAATETEINNSVNEYMEVTKFYLAVTDRPSQKGDFLDVVCEAKVDGKVYEDGSASFTTELGKNTFIEGFEEALYGRKAGDHFTLSLSYPEDYSDSTVAGKPVEFEINIDEVKIAVEPELSDAFLAAHTEYKTIAALKDALKEEIEKSKQSQESSQDQNKMLEKLAEVNEIKSLPEKEVERYKGLMGDYKTQLESSAAVYGMDLDTYIKTYSNNEFENFDAFQEKVINESIKLDLLFAQIAKNENITWDQKEYEEFIARYAMYGYESEEAFLKDTDNGATIKWQLLSNAVVEFLMENTVFVDANGNVVVRTTPTPVPTATPTVSASPAEE